MLLDSRLKVALILGYTFSKSRVKLINESEKPSKIFFWKLVVTWGSAVGSAWVRFGFWGKAICSYESKKKKSKKKKKDVKH